MIELCGSDVFEIRNHRFLSDVNKLNNNINAVKRSMVLLQSKLENVEVILKRNAKRFVVIFNSIILVIVLIVYGISSVPYIIKKEIQKRTLTRA